NRLDRRSGRRGGAAARRGHDRCPRCPSTRELHRPRGNVPRARAAGLPVRGHRPAGGPGVRVGVPSEVKPDEYRVALTPVGARELTGGRRDSGGVCSAYETVEDAVGRLPLLAPMSEIAGKIATQAGAFMLEKPLGGRGILLGGAPGVGPANVMIIGGGAVGMNAGFIAIGMEADVFVYDTNIDRLRELDI